MTYEERRENDERVEKIATERIHKDEFHVFPTFHIETDPNEQKNGVDYHLYGKTGFFYICDQKTTQLKHLPTACLECYTRIKSNNEWKYIKGWFLNDKKKTNTYVIVWLDEYENGIQCIDDIKEYECCVVKLEKIWKFLEDNGWTKDNIIKKAIDAKDNPEKYFKTEWHNNRQIGFNCSKKYYDEERPVNLLLRRETYEELSEFYYKYNNGEIRNY